MLRAHRMYYLTCDAQLACCLREGPTTRISIDAWGAAREEGWHRSYDHVNQVHRDVCPVCWTSLRIIDSLDTP